VGSYHAYIAVTRLGWVYVHGCRTGTGKRGGYFLANMTRLAHADHDYAAFAGQHNLAGLYEVSIDTIEQFTDGSTLYLYSSKSAGNERGIRVHGDQIIP
jgi:hypothetical protein